MEPTDAPATRSHDLEALLARASWVRSLARALVRGGDPAADADDVEQQTWLAALRSPPPRSPTRGWLRVVAGNVVRRFARDHHSRRRREAAAAPHEELPPQVDALERAETHGRVVAAVTGLPEPYRTTLIRRFLDELPPSRIAELDRISVETVKTRLKRGLELVRERLAIDRDWKRALLPLVRSPEWLPATTAAASIGAMLSMATKWKSLLGAGIVMVAVAGVAIDWKRRGFAARASDEGREAVAADPVATPPGAEAVATRAPVATPEAVEPTGDAAPPSTPTFRFDLAGVVRDVSGAPVANAWVFFGDERHSFAHQAADWFSAMERLDQEQEPAALAALPHVRTGVDGTFQFSALDRVRGGRVAAWHAAEGGALSGRLELGREREPPSVTLTLRPLVKLRGRFVDESGAPLPSATLLLEVDLGDESFSDGWPTARARRDDATFELPALPARSFRGFPLAGGFVGSMVEIDGSMPPRVHDLELVLRFDPRRVRVGRIVLDDGSDQPLAERLLPHRAEWERDGGGTLSDGQPTCAIVRFHETPPAVGARLPPDHWQLEGEVRLSDGTYAVEPSFVARYRYLGLVVRDVIVAIAEDAPDAPAPDLVVDPAVIPRGPSTGTLRVTLRDDGGGPVDDGRLLRVTPLHLQSLSYFRLPVIRGGSPGEFLVEHVPSGRAAVRFEIPGGARAADEVDIAPGRESRLALELQSGRARLRGFVEARRGRTHGLGRVFLFKRVGGRTMLPAIDSTEPDRDGFFSFDGLVEEEHALLALRPWGPVVALATAAVDPVPVTLPEANPRDVTIRASFSNGELPDVISLRVLRPDGTPLVDDFDTAGSRPPPGAERVVKLPIGLHLVQLFVEGAEPAQAELDPSESTVIEIPLRRR